MIESWIDSDGVERRAVPGGVVMTMADHEITVEELDDGSWDATCRCGWEDPGYEEWEDADTAGDEHLRSPGV